MPCPSYWKERKLPTVVGRLFTTVGPRQTGRYGMVIPRFERQAIANQPITVYGDGSQSRVFCHVEDVVEALVLLMGREDVYGEVFNIGGEGEITVMDLAERVKQLADSESEIAVIPTTRPTSRASRTCSAGSRTCRRSTGCSGGRRRTPSMPRSTT